MTLRCKQSKLRFTPQSFEVQPASPTGSAVLFPVWFGSDTVEAVVANYSPEPLTIVITGWLVINTNIAHNTFSVFFVALIGGYMGTAALDLVANKLGFPS